MTIDSATGDDASEPSVATNTITASSVADFVLPLSRSESHSRVTLAFGSCHKSKYADKRIWSTIASTATTAGTTNESLLAFLWTGDAIYPPVRDIASVEQLELEYDKMTHPFHGTTLNDTIGYYTSMIQPQTTIFGTWDDHDYGGNDRGNDMPDRHARAAAYWKFLNQTPPANHSGTYYSVVWTDESTTGAPLVQVIFLDTRWHRQPHCLVPSLAGKFPLGAGIACLTRWLAAGLFADYCTDHYTTDDHAMLGADQWAWLEAQLLSPRHETNGAPPVVIVVSSIQVLTTNPAMESWGQFPTERDRLVQLLHQVRHQYGSVVTLLSGDVHYGEILTPQPEMPSYHDTSFVEVTSSGLTHDCSKHIYGKICRPLLETFSRHRRSVDTTAKPDYYIGRNFGTIAIEWDKSNAAATVEIKVHDVVTGTPVLTTGPRRTQSPTPSTILSVQPCMDGHLLPYAYSLLLGLILAALVPMIWSHRRQKTSIVYN